MSACFREHNVFDVPDLVVVKILLYLNINERARLAHALGRFDILVLEGKKFLRDLDFSEEGRFTTAADIEHYFGNEDANKLILKVNLRTVTCMDTGRLFNDFISKAANLVDINMHGIRLLDLEQLASLLQPLILVRRLSIDWPANENKYNCEIRGVIGDLFGRLEYLSVRVIERECYDCFLQLSAVCQKLKALRLYYHGFGFNKFRVKRNLSNLESFEYYCENTEWAYAELFDLLPDWEKWIRLPLPRSLSEQYFWIVKDPEVSEELGKVITEDNWEEGTMFNRLLTDWLLKAVISINHTDFPENFCSLPSIPDDEYDAAWKGIPPSSGPCALTIEETKMLLKNPRHRIKYLYLNDSIRTESKSHLYSLACPRITELHLSGGLQYQLPPEVTDSPRTEHSPETNIFDPCFLMLVENTPLVADLTLDGKWRNRKIDETRDLGPLNLIQGWKNLRSLRLLWLPIRDGEFLIEIGKHCKHLEELEFYELGPSDACCYTRELSIMLSHCPNLTDFFLRADNLGEVSKFLDSITKNPKLRIVRFKSLGQKNNVTNLIPAVEQLLRRCSKLMTVYCIVDGMSQADSDQPTLALRSLIDPSGLSTICMQPLPL